MLTPTVAETRIADDVAALASSKRDRLEAAMAEGTIDGHTATPEEIAERMRKLGLGPLLDNGFRRPTRAMTDAERQAENLRTMSPAQRLRAEIAEAHRIGNEVVQLRQQGRAFDFKTLSAAQMTAYRRHVLRIDC